VTADPAGPVDPAVAAARAAVDVPALLAAWRAGVHDQWVRTRGARGCTGPGCTGCDGARYASLTCWTLPARLVLDLLDLADRPLAARRAAAAGLHADVCTCRDPGHVRLHGPAARALVAALAAARRDAP